MKLISLSGKLLPVKNLKKRRINWDGPSLSKFQFNTKQFLKQYWYADEVYEEFPVVGSKMTLDIYNHSRKIAIEVQGIAHLKYCPSFFHKGSRSKFLGQVMRDQDKFTFCEKNNIHLVEVLSEKEINEEFFLTNDAI